LGDLGVAHTTDALSGAQFNNWEQLRDDTLGEQVRDQKHNDLLQI